VVWANSQFLKTFLSTLHFYISSSCPPWTHRHQNWSRLSKRVCALDMPFGRLSCSRHLVNCAFDHTRCATDQFIKCTPFDELRNIWSIVQRTCNGVRVGVMVSFRVRVRVRLAQLAKCAARLVERRSTFGQMCRLTRLANRPGMAGIVPELNHGVPGEAHFVTEM